MQGSLREASRKTLVCAPMKITSLLEKEREMYRIGLIQKSKGGEKG